MKTILTFSFILLVCFSCTKEETVTPTQSQTTPKADVKVSSVILKISKTGGTFWANESDALTLSVDMKDDAGNVYSNYSGQVTYYANGVELSSNQFNFEKDGEYSFKAAIKGVESSLSGKYVVKNPQTEIDKLVVTNDFYNKYAVDKMVMGVGKPNFSVKGLDKSGAEIPLKKGLKLTINGQETTLENLTFNSAGIKKIQISAYGKQSELSFDVRQARTFEVVRIPIMFHFCQPSPFSHPATNQTDAQFIELAVEQLKNGKKLEQLNAMFRNQYVKNVGDIDPNAADTFIEFYLADKDPQGNILKEKGINRLNFTRPYVALTENYVYNAAQAQFDVTLANELSKWNPNAYFNVVVENFGNWVYAGIAKMPMMDNNRKSFVPQEFFNLPFINTTIDKLAWGNSNTRIFSDHVRVNGAINLLTDSPGADGTLYTNSVLSHEIGHAFGLQHTFGLQENCQDQVHSDGLYDTPRQISADYFTSCDGIKFAQRNMMNYISAPTRGYFTYDQVTVLRSRIEAAFNIPTPRNKGKSNMRVSFTQHTVDNEVFIKD